MTQPNREQINELLSAYVDGETDRRETEFVEHLLQKDESARRELEALRKTVDLVGHLPRHPSSPSIAEDIRNQIEREALLGTPEDSPTRAVQKGSPRGAWLSMAAMIGLVAIAGVWVLRDRESAGRLETRLAQADRKAVPEVSRARVEEEESRRAIGGERSSPAASAPSAAERKAPEERVGRAPVDGSINAKKRAKRTPADSIAVTERVVESRPHDATRFEEKLAQGLDAAAVRAHRFVNEPLTLRIGVTDEARREAAVRDLTALLARRDVRPLAGQQQGAAAASAKTGVFYYRGAPGINYDDAASAQMLVRVPSRDLGPLLDELALSTRTEDVSLVAGPLVFMGLPNAKGTLLRAGNYGVAQDMTRPSASEPAVRDAERRENQDADGAEPGPVASPSLEALLQKFGVAAEWVRLASSQAYKTEPPPIGEGSLSKSAPPVTAGEERDMAGDRPTLVERGLRSVRQAGASGSEAETPNQGMSELVREARVDLQTSTHAPEEDEAGRADRLVTVVVEFFIVREDRPRARGRHSEIKKDPRTGAEIRRFQH